MYWMNSKFQTLFFIVAEGHTFDNAYRIVKQQLLERRQAKQKLEEQRKEEQSMLYKTNLSHEVAPFHKERETMYEVMLDEIDFLEKLATALEPHRKYKHLPEQVAHQMAQREYWFHELVERASVQIYAKGQIDWDTMKAMRAHPDYLDMAEVLNKDFRSVQNGVHLPPPKDTPVMRFLTDVATRTLPDCSTEYERHIAGVPEPKRIVA